MKRHNLIRSIPRLYIQGYIVKPYVGKVCVYIDKMNNTSIANRKHTEIFILKSTQLSLFPLGVGYMDPILPLHSIKCHNIGQTALNQVFLYYLYPS